MKKIKMLDVEPMIIETQDGKEIKAIFNMGTIARYYSEYADFVTVEELLESQDDITTQLLMCGIETAGNENNVDLAFCETLLKGGYGVAIRNLINECLYECLDSGLDATQKKTLMNGIQGLSQAEILLIKKKLEKAH